MLCFHIIWFIDIFVLVLPHEGQTHHVREQAKKEREESEREESEREESKREESERDRTRLLRPLTRTLRDMMEH